MHDDQMLLRVYNNKIYINSPPLAARDNLRCFMGRPLQIDKIFILHKDTKCFTKSCSKEKEFINIYNEIVQPLTLGPEGARMARKTKLDICYAILQSVELFELHFNLDIDFKSCLVRDEVGE